MPKRGYLTPSSFPDLMSNGRGTNEIGRCAMNIIDRLVVEMLGTEESESDLFTPASCQWGLDNEWEAQKKYEEANLCNVGLAEFRISSTHPFVGGTMDGLVGDNGGIEIKCPYSEIQHLKNLMYGSQIEYYFYQIQGYIWIYNLDWIDFVSYDPRFSEDLQLFIKRVNRDDAAISRLIERCEKAYQMAADMVNTIKAKAGMQC